MQKHARRYEPGSDEFERRRQLFHMRSREVELLNSQANRLWRAGINELSDWTEEELNTLHGWRGGANPRRSGHAASSTNLRQVKAQVITQLPEEVSWTHLEAAQHVRNQKKCGSCWAVTSSLVLDTNSEIHLGNGKGLSSAQEFVSCVPNEQHCGGTGGCKGATVELAFNWAMYNGLSPDSSMPYKGQDSECKKRFRQYNGHDIAMADTLDVGLDSPLSLEDLTAPGVHLAQSPSMPGLLHGLLGWERLPENQYEPLLRAVAERGPVGVSVSGKPLHHYNSGIFDNCGKDAVIDHAVTLMGYGKDKDLHAKYWLVQNSWGKSWGEHGLFRLLRRNDDDVHQCGKDMQPERGTGCNGGPTEVQVCGMCGILYDSVVPHFQQRNKTAANRYW